MNVELWSITPDSERLIARCARVSHRAEGKGPEDDRKLLRKLVQLGHLSVLEHAQATFLIDGISRACLAQLTRHRHLSFTVESGRFTVARELFIYPATLLGNRVARDAYAAVRASYAAAWATYQALLAQGVPKEDARFVLPQAQATRLALSGNFRALYEFLQKRLMPDAQWEIRALAKELAIKLAGVAPSVFQGFLSDAGEAVE